ncbi:MAG: hypothetical protein ISS01_01965 [Nanoarchaeota archaeon]|nr:hypothetical protein [Nanoarchaeota archaeon]
MITEYSQKLATKLGLPKNTSHEDIMLEYQRRKWKNFETKQKPICLRLDAKLGTELAEALETFYQQHDIFSMHSYDKPEDPSAKIAVEKSLEVITRLLQSPADFSEVVRPLYFGMVGSLFETVQDYCSSQNSLNSTSYPTKIDPLFNTLY